jgi:hypothetical protein
MKAAIEMAIAESYSVSSAVSEWLMAGNGMQ